MRRSKSNPAKYARNYRKISQRQMTQFDNIDEEKEMIRLQKILKNSRDHLKDYSESEEESNTKKKKKKRKVSEDEEKEDKVDTSPKDDAAENSDDEFVRARALLINSTAHLRPSTAEPEKKDMKLQPKKGKKRNRKRASAETVEEEEGKDKQSAMEKDDKQEQYLENENSSKKDSSSLLSKEFMDEHQEPESVENPLIVIPVKKKQKKKKQSRVELTAEEIKDAKKLQKNTERKLKQLAQRAESKKKRAELYEKLQKTAINPEEMKLMSSSSTLGKRVTKKEQLKQLLQRERAGMELTAEEKDLLYRGGRSSGAQEDDNSSDSDSDSDSDDDVAKSKSKSKVKAKGTNKKDNGGKTNDKKNEEASTSKPNANSFAAQMMASLSNLKASSEKQKEENEKKKQQEEEERQRLEEERLAKAAKGKAPYKPSEPIVIQTAATNKKLQVHEMPKSNRRALTVERPSDVKESRYNLPVAQMEFEVMDAIRNNDVVIVCGETGSGKSTQVPQLMYESGFTLGVAGQKEHKYLIGITQPRRVAAVSTAKRVCYEMGQGDGLTIKSKKRADGNLVAYQTRYETAGLGKETSVKFMTDGILLQEIQSDLLLRKYSVIVLDECHERNLNCDILCGLIGLALPLRKKASEEPGSDIVPLKLVVMSATLRVDDFVSNKKLFPSTTPFVIKVPGRTFPVTIHHSKITEIDNYEDAAFKKICKIHRRLPDGAILVFLTGKQEIVRMVNRLRKALSPKQKSAAHSPFVGSRDVEISRTDIAFSTETGPRDLDDDEVDGDLLHSNEDDFDDAMDDEVDTMKEEKAAQAQSKEHSDDNIPDKVLVLPLYSMLSAEEQAQVFAATPDNCRLIVVSTNIAETSITIPGVKYVVDTGRQKCKNYDAKTGVASFDISWISKAAANQRAGRAGRTGPGHCYRLYSSSMFSRHMDDFALPEVLVRPLEDVILAMKAMNISNVSKFPFPTPPAESQVTAAVKLLANLGCVGLDTTKDIDGDGEVTPLGAAVSTFPLGVRCGKMLLMAAHAGVLDYAIAIIAALSEKNPFLRGGEQQANKDDSINVGKEEDSDDQSVETDSKETEKKVKVNKKWVHKGGDVYAVMLAIGAYTFAGRGAGGISEQVACKQFCGENRLNHVIMERIQKIRVHLSRLVKARMAGAAGVAAKTGEIPHSMKPPNKVQEQLLLQVIASGMLDNVAMLAPLGSIPGTHPFSLRSAFLSCSSSIKEPLFMDRNSVLFSRDSRQLPQWVCYDYLVRKNLKDGTPIATMKNVTPVDPSWLGTLAKGSNLLSLGGPLPAPRPSYDAERDEVMCAVETKFGSHNWEITPVKMRMSDALRKPEAKHSMHFHLDDTYRYFGRFLLEGKVLAELKELASFLNDSPSVMTSKTPSGKVGLIVSALSDAEVDSCAKLLQHWTDVDDKFLFKTLKKWVKPQFSSQAKRDRKSVV